MNKYANIGLILGCLENNIDPENVIDTERVFDVESTNPTYRHAANTFYKSAMIMMSKELEDNNFTATPAYHILKIASTKENLSYEETELMDSIFSVIGESIVKGANHDHLVKSAILGDLAVRGALGAATSTPDLAKWLVGGSALGGAAIGGLTWGAKRETEREDSNIQNLKAKIDEYKKMQYLLGKDMHNEKIQDPQQLQKLINNY